MVRAWYVHGCADSPSGALGVRTEAYACARGCDAPAGGVKSIEAGGDTSDVEADGRGDEPLGRPMPPLQVTWRSKQLIGRGEL